MSRLLLALIVALPLPQDAAAQRSRDVARQLVREGLELLEKRDCKTALGRFLRARVVFPTSYKVDVNIGTALECLGWLTEAADSFDRFLDRADTVADRDMAVGVREKLQSLRAKLATLTIRGGEAAATIAVDGAVVGQAPLARPIHLRPGKHLLIVSKGERSFTVTLALAAGGRSTVSAEWPPSPSARRPPAALAAAPVKHPARERSRGLVVGGIVAFGAPWVAAVTTSAAMGLFGTWSRAAPVLWIPVAGPAAVLGMDRSLSAGAAALLVLWTLTQAAGAAILAAGLIGHKRTAATVALDSWRVEPLLGAVNGVGLLRHF